MNEVCQLAVTAPGAKVDGRRRVSSVRRRDEYGKVEPNLYNKAECVEMQTCG